MTKLIELKAPRDRFARSINVERDSGTSAIDGYLPVGRAIESVERLASALLAHGEVALSVTGPYGSGKSSLAPVLDSLFAARTATARASAEQLILDSAPEVMALVSDARKHVGADRHGFIRAVVTAQREPIARTVVRALQHGLSRYDAPSKRRSQAQALLTRLYALTEGFQTGDVAVDTRQIRELVHQMSEIGPVLLLIDEFGKNLEAFAEAPGEGDLFLLQELAEWTRSTERNRVAIVTLQHMAFGDYADGASGAQRREWMKIQGRFEDVPFVDTPSQTRALIAASFEKPVGRLVKPIEEWTRHQCDQLRGLGLSELAEDVGSIAQSWPLHPLSLAVLPDLCHRYGQNERTMFSFLATREPRSVGRFLAEQTFEVRASLPAVTLDRLYDYFIESAANMVGVSADASRWIEIDTRIRDAHGLPDASRRVLKAVGLLNLVSTGGTLRASEAMVKYAAIDSQPGTGSADEVSEQLHELESRGLITYRDFADEFRVWQGSDFDLKSAVVQARRRLRDQSADQVLSQVLPLGPVVAARHSHQTGTLRAFERSWVSHGAVVSPLRGADRGDGLVAYVVGGPFEGSIAGDRQSKPVVTGQADTEGLVEAAREVLAIDDVLATDDSVKNDWVVRKELAERRVAAVISARREFELAFGALAKVSWHWANDPRDSGFSEKGGALASVVSRVADECYASAIPVFNDLLNRHELSSQAARARREVAEVMSARQNDASLRLEGFGPDRTLYLSLLSEFGLHREVDGIWRFTPPDKDSKAAPVWHAMVGHIRGATEARINVASVYELMALPPYGLRAGVAPILLIAIMCAHADEFAMYEHGTFRPRLSADIAERLLRNPGNFELKCFGTRSRARSAFVREISAALQPSAGHLSTTAPSVVTVVSSLVARINVLTTFAKKTRELSDRAVAVRTALLSATEPDDLLFERLPAAVGHVRIGTSDRRDPAEYQALALAVADGMRELEQATPALRRRIRQVLETELRAEGDAQASLTRRSIELREKILDPRLKSLATALHADMAEDEWLAYVAMQVVGTPPDGWGDDEVNRFELTMHDLGAAFLRVEALTADKRAMEGQFDAVRVAVNSTRGGDFVRLVSVDPSRSKAIGEALVPVLESLGRQGVAEQEARDWILAHLLESELERAARPRDVGARPYSRDNKGKKGLA